jgi:hypothetical protein
MPRLAVAVFSLVAIAACGHAKAPVAPGAVAALSSLDDVMEAQEHAAEPHFAKVGRASFTPEEFAELGRVGELLQATSKKTLEFSRGPGFDALANQLGANAKALSDAAAAKDAAGASKALGDTKATCDTCHSQFH